MKKILATIVIVGVIILGGGLVYIYSGSYNVAATSSDSPLVAWIMHTTREQSVEHRIESIKIPADVSLDDPKVIKSGFEHYNEMCTACHGAPGVNPGEVHDGLNPKPPDLKKIANKIPPNELFWVIKHGIKMTGMPAWGPTHSDSKIWTIVAFVKKLPDITPTEYRQMQKQVAASGDKNQDHGS
jgi:mono/diheme cytochrome c family protein